MKKIVVSGISLLILWILLVFQLYLVGIINSPISLIKAVLVCALIVIALIVIAIIIGKVIR